MIVQDYQLDLTDPHHIKIIYAGTNGGVITRRVDDLFDLRQFLISKANEFDISVRGLRITLVHRVDA